VLFAGIFINRFGGFVTFFLILYLTRRGFSPAQAGLAVGAFGAGSVLSNPVSGSLADRIGRRETLMVASVAAAVSTMALGFATSLPVVIVLAGATGLANQLFRAPAFALVADLVPPEGQMAAVGINRLAVNAGFAAGPAVAGLLADHSFILVFVGDAATSLVFGLIAMLWLPRGAPFRSVPQKRGDSLRVIGADRSFLLFCLASLMMSAVYIQTTTAFPLWVHQNGFNNTTYGLLLGLNGAIVVALELALISVTQRIAIRQTMVAGYLLMGLGFAATGLAHSLIPIAITVFVWTLGEMIGFPPGNVWVANVSPQHMRGRYQGVFGMFVASGATLGPGVGGLVFQRSPIALWIGCGVVGTLAALLVAVLPAARADRPQAMPITPEPSAVA